MKAEILWNDSRVTTEELDEDQVGVQGWAEALEGVSALFSELGPLGMAANDDPPHWPVEITIKDVMD